MIQSVSGNELYFAKIRPTAIIPSKKKEDAGYDLYADFQTYLAGKDNAYRFNFISLKSIPSGTSYEAANYNSYLYDKTFSYYMQFNGIDTAYIAVSILTASGSSAKSVALTDGTITDNSATVPTSGSVELNIMEYAIM